MAIFWTFTEGLILIILRWGFLALHRGDGRQKKFIISSTLLFVLLGTLLFGGEALIREYIDLSLPSNLTAYRWSLVNLFCTLWVVLEGIIMVYVYRIYRTIKSPSNRGDLHPKARSFNCIPLFILTLLGLYAFYHFNLFLVMDLHRINPKNIYRISVFYIRICGLFWILFEWVVAAIGIKTYTFLKQREAWG